MSEATQSQDSQYFISSQQQYIFAPLSTATRLLGREQEELADERAAFEAFEARLQSIPPIESTTDQHPATGLSCQSTDTRRGTQLRNAYRQTVIDVPHYERVYDETLEEHFKNEFGPKYVGVFEAATSAAFTPQYKSALQLKIRETVKRREEVLRMLDGEEKSVRDAWTSLEEICSPLQTTVIPDWYTDSFTTRLDEIASGRQERLQERYGLDHTQDLSLCAYAYDDQPWTYPVLTSVARVRETVTFDR